jgi:hypothetical protein
MMLRLSRIAISLLADPIFLEKNFAFAMAHLPYPK